MRVLQGMKRSFGALALALLIAGCGGPVDEQFDGQDVPVGEELGEVSGALTWAPECVISTSCGWQCRTVSNFCASSLRLKVISDFGRDSVCKSVAGNGGSKDFTYGGAFNHVASGC